MISPLRSFGIALASLLASLSGCAEATSGRQSSPTPSLHSETCGRSVDTISTPDASRGWISRCSCKSVPKVLALSTSPMLSQPSCRTRRMRCFPGRHTKA